MNKRVTQTNREKVGERVTIYKRKNTWYANYQLDGQQRRESLSTANRKEARRAALIIESELLQGTRVPVVSPVSIDDAADEYVASVQSAGRAESTSKRYRRVLKHLSTFAKAKRVSHLHQVTVRFIDSYRSWRRDDGIAAKTIYSEVNMIRQLVNFGLTRNLLASDPLKGLKNPEPKSTPQPCWSEEELDLIIASAEEPQRSLFTVYADTGMRFAEARWLTWEDINLESNVIQIRPKDDWKPKSGEAREVPMTPRVREMLQRQPRAFRWVFTAGPSKKFPDGGNQISERRLLRSLKRLLKRVGLPQEGKIHTFRHSFISKALAKGVPSTTVKSWVGHVSDEMLERYNHVLKQQAQEAMSRFAG